MLAGKRLSWWGLKWNWHFQFVPWHVRLGLFTHSSTSPHSCNPPIRPPHRSLPLSLFLPSTSLQTSSPINLGWTFSWNAHSQARKYGADSFISYTKHVHRNMRALYYKYAFSTWDSFQATDASECIKEWQRSLYRKEKMRKKTGETQEAMVLTHVSHGCYSFWTQMFELESSLIFSTVAVVLA